MEEIIFDYNVVMFIVKHISSAGEKDLSDFEKMKLVISFLENNNLKTNVISNSAQG